MRRTSRPVTAQRSAVWPATLTALWTSARVPHLLPVRSIRVPATSHELPVAHQLLRPIPPTCDKTRPPTLIGEAKGPLVAQNVVPRLQRSPQRETKQITRPVSARRLFRRNTPKHSQLRHQHNIPARKKQLRHQDHAEHHLHPRAPLAGLALSRRPAVGQAVFRKNVSTSTKHENKNKTKTRSQPKPCYGLN